MSDNQPLRSSKQLKMVIDGLTRQVRQAEQYQYSTHGRFMLADLAAVRESCDQLLHHFFRPDKNDVPEHNRLLTTQLTNCMISLLGMVVTADHVIDTMKSGDD